MTEHDKIITYLDGYNDGYIQALEDMQKAENGIKRQRLIEYFEKWEEQKNA